MKNLFRVVTSSLEAGAESLLDAVIEEQARDLNETARHALETGDNTAARQSWQQARALSPDHPEATNGLRSIERRSVARPERPIRLNGRPQAVLLIKQANQAHESGDDPLAIAILREALPEAMSDPALVETIRDTIGLLEERIRAMETAVPSSGRRVFISYAHADERWRDEVRTHLRAATAKFGDVIWDDSRIRPGDRWEDEIERTVEEAEIAVLLLTSSFFASDFVRTRELPMLEARASIGRTRVIPVFLRTFPVDPVDFVLSLQGVGTPTNPICGMSDADRDRSLATLAEQVRDHLS